MNYSHLTKEEIINGIKNNSIELDELSESWRDNKDVVLEAVKKDGTVLFTASERLRNDKKCLEILEKNDISNWYNEEKKWYVEKIEVLANIRCQEEKKIIESSINSNDITSKKIKF